MRRFESTQFLKFKLGLEKYGLEVTSSSLPAFVNKVLLDLGMLSDLCVGCDCFLITKAELVVVKRSYGLQSLKYLLSGPFKGMYADSWSKLYMKITCRVHSRYCICTYKLM